jgi:hypothetical protein
MRLLDDNPAVEDALHFSEMVDILHGVLRDPPRLPFTIGIFGEWGSGKSTLMDMIRRRLMDEHVKTVWFNAWKYDAKEVMWNALIQKIFYTMQHDPEVEQREDKEEFRERVGQVAAGLAVYAAKVATRFVPGGIVKEEDVDAIVEALRPPSANDDLFDFVNRFEDTFRRLVRDYVGESGYLVIFIDDLDRCLPENAIMVLEALKLYLDSADCIFVIAAESSVIEEGIRQRYHDNPRLSGKDYLEKIVQLPFIMPRIMPDRALMLLDPYEKTLAYRSDENVRALIVAGTECNPRRIKRFINAFWVLSTIAGPLNERDRLELAKVLLIQMRFPRLYYALADDPGLLDHMAEVVSSKTVNVKSQLEREPPEVRALLEDGDVVAFLRKTQQITAAPDRIARWVSLTRGKEALSGGGDGGR